MHSVLGELGLMDGQGAQCLVPVYAVESWGPPSPDRRLPRASPPVLTLPHSKAQGFFSPPTCLSNLRSDLFYLPGRLFCGFAAGRERHLTYVTGGPTVIELLNYKWITLKLKRVL